MPRKKAKKADAATEEARAAVEDTLLVDHVRVFDVVGGYGE